MSIEPGKEAEAFCACRREDEARDALLAAALAWAAADAERLRLVSYVQPDEGGADHDGHPHEEEG